jgi:uncharacterized YccA/Bax inhibitor family protein
MRSSNPVFNREEAFARGGYAGFREPAGTATQTASARALEDLYAQPSATPLRAGQMSYDDVVTKTGITFLVLLAGAAVGWIYPGLALPGALIGFVLAMVNSFKREPSPALILAYAGFEGLFVGGISHIFETRWSGIVAQAVLGTLCVFAAALFAFKSGKVQVTPRFRKMAMVAILGYLVFSLVNLGLVLFNVVDDPWGLRNGPMGILIGLFAVGLAAVFLVLDFDFVQQGVRNGLPDKYSWTAAFGLTVTLVWLYLEMLRLIAILRGDN